jgi:hypothetical protein
VPITKMSCAVNKNMVEKGKACADNKRVMCR